MGGYVFDDADHTTMLKMTVGEFIKTAGLHDVAGAEAGGAAGATGAAGASARYYLQTPLVEGVDRDMLDDFTKFEWEWVSGLASRNHGCLPRGHPWSHGCLPRGHPPPRFSEGAEPAWSCRAR